MLRLLALGLDNDAIAEKLVISKRTVQNHVSAIYGKLNLDSRAEAILYAIRHKLVDVNEVKEPYIVGSPNLLRTRFSHAPIPNPT